MPYFISASLLKKCPGCFAIKLAIAGDADVVAAANTHAEYIKNEVLALELAVAEGCGEVDLNGHQAALSLSKA